MTLRPERIGEVLRLALDKAPVNALDTATREALMAAIAQAASDPEIRGVLLTGAGHRFSAGADITEFGTLRPPGLPQVIGALEALDKPVVALVEGIALGGGFELALGAHVRLATRTARFGFPEIRLGLLPGAGGTQRLPRLTGADTAIELMASGRQVDATEAYDLGLVDALCGEAPEKEALAALHELIAEGGPLPRLRDCRIGLEDPDVYLGQIAAWRKAIAGQGPAALGRIVDCVEAALLLPFEQGLDYEWTAFTDCLALPESRALRHLFLAERAAMRFARAAPAARVARLGIIGAGRTGAALAASALHAGLSVSVQEQDSYAAERTARRVARALEAHVARGEMTGTMLSDCLGRLTAGIGTVALGTPELVLECVDEDPGLKSRLLAEAATQLGPNVPLGTTSARCDPARLAAGVQNPERVFLFHPAPPAGQTRLIELAPARPATSRTTLSTAAYFARAIGRTPILTGGGTGRLVNRLTQALRTACDNMLETGATPEQIDAAFRAWGFPLGPYQALDREGLDDAWNGHRTGTGSGIAARLIEAGRLGRRQGQGYYDYREDGRAVVSQQVQELIATERAERGIPQRSYADAEIVSRGLDALANAGFAALDEGLAASAGDIDVACHHGFGFPRSRGGPMFNAGLGGLPALVARLDARTAEAPALWTPASGLRARTRDARSEPEPTSSSW